MVSYIPEHDEFRRLAERLGLQVSRMFDDVATQVQVEIARRFTKGLPEWPSLTQQLAAVQQVEAYARRLLDSMTDDLATEIISTAAKYGTRAAIERIALVKDLPRTSLTESGVALGVTESAAMAAALVAFDLGNAYDEVKARILRYPRDAMDRFIVGGDVYQQVIARSVAGRLLGAESTSAARKRALQEFLDRGVTGFTDRANRNWRIGSYTDMATRTAVVRASQDASMHRMSEVDITLGSIVGNANACEHCAPWFGKILSTDGRTGWVTVRHGYEGRPVDVFVHGTIEQARADGWQHPNCSCEWVGWVPGMPVAVGAEGYDDDKRRARDRSRELERELRDHKRKHAIAEAMGDDVKARKEKRHILDLQADLREHVKETGEHRRYEREQVRFADGAQ